MWLEEDTKLLIVFYVLWNLESKVFIYFVYTGNFLGLDDELKGHITVAVIEGAHVAVDTFFLIR